jgi:hypothetical protein
MIHPLVTQLHFTRGEFARCFEGISADDGSRRAEPMNSLSWTVGHLALQEHWLWIELGQGRNITPDLRQRFGTGQPATTPPWNEMWDLWHTITKEADVYLLNLQPEDLKVHFHRDGKPMPDDVGTLLLRNIFHYWFHLGKAHSIRQVLGHTNLPQYVGTMSIVRHTLEAEG